ncbi:MAG: diguanylate cyclase [Anaerolineales bacterium]
MCALLEETFDSNVDASLAENLSNKQPVLIVLNGDQIGKRFPLQGASAIIGRDPERANIVLSDRTVSGMHSRIDYDAGSSQYVITDLQSRNGVLVNLDRTENGPLSREDKIFIGSIILKFTFEDIVESTYRTRLDELLNLDELTGLPVKRVFDHEFRRAFEFAARRGTRLALLMMDLDGLKRINDTHGHLLGSHTIAEAGRIIGRSIGRKGLACRYGGDEFIAFVRNLTLSKAEELGERIRARIEGHKFVLNGQNASPTISIGVAERTDRVQSPPELVLIADEALYRAKAAGRNAVSH